LWYFETIGHQGMQFKWKYSHLSNIFMDHCRFSFPVLVSNLCTLRRLLKRILSLHLKRFFEKEKNVEIEKIMKSVLKAEQKK
jgi:hypothetical protein